MIRKVITYIKYVRTLKKLWPEMSEQFVLTKDITWTFGTVINMRPLDIKDYGPAMAEKIVKGYIRDMDRYCSAHGLRELVCVRSVKPIDALNYKVVFGFAGFNALTVFNVLLRVLAVTGVAGTLWAVL